MEPGSRGQEAVEENAKIRAMKVRREWAGQGAHRGTGQALLWELLEMWESV